MAHWHRGYDMTLPLTRYIFRSYREVWTVNLPPILPSCVSRSGVPRAHAAPTSNDATGWLPAARHDISVLCRLHHDLVGVLPVRLEEQHPHAQIVQRHLHRQTQQIRHGGGDSGGLGVIASRSQGLRAHY